MAVDGADGRGRRVRGRPDARRDRSPASPPYVGVGRRFELKGDVGGVSCSTTTPTIRPRCAATFAAARLRYPGRRLWAVYEPLTFHRTAAMLDAFADVLAEADRAAVIDIWAVRDPDRTITRPAELADAVTPALLVPARAIGSPEAGAAWLADACRTRRRRPGDGWRPLLRRRGAARARLRERAAADR